MAVLAIIVYATLSPLQLRPVLARSADAERLAAFVALTLCLGLAFPRRIALVLLLALGLGAGLELWQTLRPDRHGTVHDYLVKAAGAVIGAGLAWAITQLRRAMRPSAQAAGEVDRGVGRQPLSGGRDIGPDRKTD